MSDPTFRVCFDECVTDAEPPVAEPSRGVYVVTGEVNVICLNNYVFGGGESSTTL